MQIIIAVNAANDKGDLFTERMKDVVHALGYETQHVNVHKPGREIDIHAKHRIEDRRLIAECKAQSRPVSGADLNKFAGVLQVEREQDPRLTGYFMSLSGFTAPARIQEEQFTQRRFELMGPDRIIEELIQGRVIVEPTAAFYAAGQLTDLPPGSQIATEAYVVLHRIGWIWAVQLMRTRKSVDIVLVHANGQLLTHELAKEVAADLKTMRGPFIVHIPPPNLESISPLVEAEYREYVVREFGSLTLEGLPVDQYASASVHKLEDVYVPMRLEVPRLESDSESLDFSEQDDNIAEGTQSARMTLSQALPVGGKIAILAAPGGGKSTLIRRLAVAFADSARRHEISDSLPEETWLPLVIRGRDIQRVGVTSILDHIYDMPRRAELTSEFIEPFRRMLDRRLQAGQVLLMIDGLDEVSTESDRRLFVHQLRTFISKYPTIQLIVTSREAGYRIVAAEVGTYCTVYQLSELADDDIHHLVSLWYANVGRTDKDPAVQARDVTQKILDNDRVHRLAANPLLLTTLLYVQRWAGEIPKRRVLLYDRAIDLLLMTWNVEGHAPLRIDEVLPQLAHLAFQMMMRNMQRISSGDAERDFVEARNAMPEVLAYSVETPRDMIRRIESRSSLLMLAGYGAEDGQIQPYYEFRHLTFQEYLAALAIANEWAPESTELSAEEILLSHFTDPAWSEVIVLCSVLLGRRGSDLIWELIRVISERADSLGATDDDDDRFYTDMMLLTDVLYASLVDEAQLKPQDARIAVDMIIEIGNLHSCEDLLASRYEAVVIDAIRDALTAQSGGLEYFWLAADVVMRRVLSGQSPSLDVLLLDLFSSQKTVDILSGLSAVMRCSYEKVGGGSAPGYREHFAKQANIVATYRANIIEFLVSKQGDWFVWGCGCWALGWCHTFLQMSREDKLRLAPGLLDALFQNDYERTSDQAGWIVFEAFSQMWSDLAKMLSDEQNRLVTARLNDLSTSEFRDRKALAIAAIAATNPRKFGRTRILKFCKAHMSESEDGWTIIVELLDSPKFSRRHGQGRATVRKEGEEQNAIG